MNLPHDKFCVLPWISLETSPIGTVRPCCLALDEIVDDSGNKFQLNESSLEEIQNSQHMIRLREEFIAGRQPQTCRRCWSEEAAGRTSKRMHTIDRLKHIVQDQHWTRTAKPLMFLDLKLGNICNLKCRICGSWSSSTFATEELSQFIDQQEKKQSFHYEMLRAGAWPRASEHFWQELETHMDQVRYIEFTGGEPFMIREHFDLLQRLIDRGVAGNIEIHYNTNGTQWPDAEAIWQHFRHVEIAFSIDDVGERFEYQRTNAIWTEVVDNIAKFKDMRQRCRNITLQVCSTVNVYNVMYLEELANWIDQQQFDFIYWNMLHDPYFLSVATMPTAVKHLAVERLESSCVSGFHRQEFDRIKEFILNGNDMDSHLLLMNIQDLDRRRQHRLDIVAPELAEAIGYGSTQ